MTSSFSHIVRMGLIVFATITSTSFVDAQLREDLRNDLLVYIQHSALEFPANEPGPVSIEQLNTSSELRDAFSRFNIDRIQKALPAITDADTVVLRQDGVAVRLPQVSRIFRVRIPNVNDIDSAIAHFSRIPGVSFAERHSEMSVHTDDLYGRQWHLNNTGQTGGAAGADIRAELAWQIYTGNSALKLGIIDTGVETTHDDLDGKSSGDGPESYPYNDYAHGTHVAGIAAARHGNNGMVRGVDANVQVISKKVFSGDVFDENCLCDVAAWAGDNNAYQKIVEAVNSGASALNHSYGGGTYSTTLRMAFAYAYKMDRVSTVAMGNDNSGTPSFPAAFGQGIIAVGATTHDDLRASFSNFGNHIDVTGPGLSIVSTWRGNAYDSISGTSMAAPIVTGIATLLKGYNSSLYNDDIENILKLSADDKGSVGWDPEYGYGRVNAQKALLLANSVQHASVTGGSSVGFVSGHTPFYGISGLTDGYNYLTERHEVRASVTFSPAFQDAPSVWGRGAATTGFNTEDPNFGLGFCEPVPGTITHRCPASDLCVRRLGA